MDQGGPPAQFDVNVVHRALQNLYSNVELATSELAAVCPEASVASGITERAQALRNLLLEAIEELRPPRQVEADSPTQRSYKVLYLRYVAESPIREMEERLSLGRRQIFRELRRAEGEVAQVLQKRLSPVPQQPRQRGDPLQTELDALAANAQLTDLGDLLRRALATVAPLATARHVQIVERLSGEPMRVLTPPGALGQVLVQILSASVQRCAPPGLRVDLDRKAGSASVRIAYTEAEVSREGNLLPQALRMAQSLGAMCDTASESGARVLSLTFPIVRPLPVLFVEDSAPTCELYQRYLQDSPWQAVIVHDPTMLEGMIASLRPAAIVLDLLMPQVEGWSVLQNLRLLPETRDIPVIVCSVVSDPELATALGAAATLKKPMARMDLLATLQHVALHYHSASRPT